MAHIVEYTNQEYKREGTHLVLMLHGYGSQERDLLQIGNMIGGPITWAGMRAPQPVGSVIENDAISAHIPGAAFGYQWFPLDRSLHSDMRAVELASDYVLEFIEQEKNKYRSVSLLGFSQGMGLATSIARHRPDLIRSVIGLSGFVVDEETDYFDDLAFTTANIPVFYGRGDADPVIPEAMVKHAEAWLPEHAELEARLYSGMQHSICREEIDHVAGFVGKYILGK